MNRNNHAAILTGAILLLGALIFGIACITNNLDAYNSSAPGKAAGPQTVLLRFTAVDAASGRMIDKDEITKIEFIEGLRPDGSYTNASKHQEKWGERPWEISAKVDGPLTISISAQGYVAEDILLDPATASATSGSKVPVRVVRLNRVP